MQPWYLSYCCCFGNHCCPLRNKCPLGGATNFLMSIITYCPPQQHLVDVHFENRSCGCRNTNNNFEIKVAFLLIFLFRHTGLISVDVLWHSSWNMSISSYTSPLSTKLQFSYWTSLLLGHLSIFFYFFLSCCFCHPLCQKNLLNQFVILRPAYETENLQFSILCNDNL